MAKGRSKSLLARIFDEDEGWPFPQTEFPIRQEQLSRDGGPIYVVTVNGLEILVYYVNGQDTESEFLPSRINFRYAFSGITDIQYKGLLEANFDTQSLPSFGIDPADGQPVMDATIPVIEEMSLEVTRGQVMMCIGMVADHAAEILAAWERNAEQTTETGKENSEASELIERGAILAAKVAGTFFGFR